ACFKAYLVAKHSLHDDHSQRQLIKKRLFTTAMYENVIKIPCSSDEHDFVLVHVSWDSDTSQSLTLVGSEGENVYAVTIDKSRKSTGVKWKDEAPPEQEVVDHLFSTIFLGDNAVIASSHDTDREVRGLYQAVAAIKSDTLIITIQKKIEGIIEKLGEITLLPEELDISLFSWCSLTIQSRQSLLHELDKTKSVLRRKDEEIKILKETLDQMTDLKRQHEDILLKKFTLLLNEKKAKIRDQERRLFMSSSTDNFMDLRKPVAAVVHEKDKTSTKLSPGSKNPSKRSKRQASQLYDSEDESDPRGIEMMGTMDVDIDADVDAVAGVSDENTKTTPTVSVTETDSDEEGTHSILLQERNKTVYESRIDPDDVSAVPYEAEAVILPPKRELPFMKREKWTTRSKTPIEHSQSESDDEL
ncbi:hypothetical protein Golomagni_05722, partial [Golovinomyces magnicellulatus]